MKPEIFFTSRIRKSLPSSYYIPAIHYNTHVLHAHSLSLSLPSLMKYVLLLSPLHICGNRPKDVEFTCPRSHTANANLNLRTIHNLHQYKYHLPACVPTSVSTEGKITGS